jgi:hypothetical protein
LRKAKRSEIDGNYGEISELVPLTWGLTFLVELPNTATTSRQGLSVHLKNKLQKSVKVLFSVPCFGVLR